MLKKQKYNIIYFLGGTGTMNNKILFSLMLSSSLIIAMHEDSQDQLKVHLGRVLFMMSKIRVGTGINTWYPSEYAVLCHMFNDVGRPLTCSECDEQYRPRYLAYFERRFPGLIGLAQKEIQPGQAHSTGKIDRAIQHIAWDYFKTSPTDYERHYIMIPRHCCEEQKET